MENIQVLVIYMGISLILSLFFLILHKVASTYRCFKENSWIDRETLHTFQIATFTFLWYDVANFINFLLLF